MDKIYNYRVATTADLKQIKALGLISYGQYKAILDEENWSIMESNLNDELAYQKLLEIATCFVCEIAEEIIGMAFLIPSGNPTKIFQTEWSYIRLIGVNPQFEGNGIGKKLTQLCIDLAKNLNEKTIALHTSEFQDAARHIYENLGFEKKKEFQNLGKRFWVYKLELNDENNNITYHKATLNDIETLVNNRILFAIELGGTQNEAFIMALRNQMTDYFSKATIENTCISIIAKYNGVVAGIGSVHLRDMPGNFKNPSGKWGYIMNMYTVPEYRRKGICKGILNELMSEAEKYGYKAFDLHATKEGELVYKQNGFEIYNEPTYRKFITNEAK